MGADWDTRATSLHYVVSLRRLNSACCSAPRNSSKIIENLVVVFGGFSDSGFVQRPVGADWDTRATRLYYVMSLRRLNGVSCSAPTNSNKIFEKMTDEKNTEISKKLAQTVTEKV